MSKVSQTNNSLYNEAAMSVLRDAATKLESLGVHVLLSPNDVHDGDMSVVLHAALTDKAVVGSYCLASLGGELVNSGELAERFAQVKEHYLSDREELRSQAN